MKKKITLPSGATCAIRVPTGEDSYAAGMDSFEDVFTVLGDAEKAQDKSVKAAMSLNVDQRSRMLTASQRLLLRCVSPVTLKDGRRLRLVEKDLDLVNDNTELHVTSLDDADYTSLKEQWAEFKKEVADAARPFRPQSANPDVARQGGEAVRYDAQPVAQAAG